MCGLPLLDDQVRPLRMVPRLCSADPGVPVLEFVPIVVCDHFQVAFIQIDEGA
jgi:hypothetical protein